MEHKTMGAQITCKVFGYPEDEVPAIVEHFDELMNTFVHQLMKGSGLAKSTGRLVEHIENSVPRIVTPQGPRKSWELRANAVTLPSGEVEASLFPLIRNCIGTLSSTELMGSDLVDSHPDLLEDVWQIDANIMGFVFGYPSWLPSIRKATQAKTRILEKMTRWHRTMEDVGGIATPNANNARFEDVSDLMKERQAIWSRLKFSTRARAAVDLSILWALNANSNSAAYWTIVNLHDHPDILDAVRREIAPYAIFDSNQRLSLDWRALLEDCPLLKASYLESLRLDSAPWSFKMLQQDAVIQANPTDPRRESSIFKLRKGDAALVPADLHHTDPAYFPSPSAFDPSRFLHLDAGGKVTAEIGSIRPYGGGSTMCKGRMLAEREVLSFVAAILTCWDLVPGDGSSWGMHGRVKTSGVCAPKDEIRVKLVPRQGTGVTEG